MQQKYYWIIGIIAIIIIAGVILITNYPLKPTIPSKGEEIGFDPTCGGVYDPIPEGITDEDGKYTLRVDNEVGTIFVKDSVTGNPAPNIGLRFMVACSSLETSGAEPQPRSLSTISFQLMESEEYNTDVGTVSFISDTGPVSEVTVLVISKNASVPDAQSAIQIAQADERVRSWSSDLDKVYPNADVRNGKWRVYFQGVKGDEGGFFLTVYVDPKTKEVTEYEETRA